MRVHARSSLVACDSLLQFSLCAFCGALNLCQKYGHTEAYRIHFVETHHEDTNRAGVVSRYGHTKGMRDVWIQRETRDSTRF